MVRPDGRTLYFTSPRSVVEDARSEALTYAELPELLDSPGNGYCDIYSVSLDWRSWASRGERRPRASERMRYDFKIALRSASSRRAHIHQRGRTRTGVMTVSYQPLRTALTDPDSALALE